MADVREALEQLAKAAEAFRNVERYEGQQFRVVVAFDVALARAKKTLELVPADGPHVVDADRLVAACEAGRSLVASAERAHPGNDWWGVQIARRHLEALLAAARP